MLLGPCLDQGFWGFVTLGVCGWDLRRDRRGRGPSGLVLGGRVLATVAACGRDRISPAAIAALAGFVLAGGGGGCALARGLRRRRGRRSVPRRLLEGSRRGAGGRCRRAGGPSRRR